MFTEQVLNALTKETTSRTTSAVLIPKSIFKFAIGVKPTNGAVYKTKITACHQFTEADLIEHHRANDLADVNWLINAYVQHIDFNFLSNGDLELSFTVTDVASFEKFKKVRMPNLCNYLGNVKGLRTIYFESYGSELSHFH